MIDITYDPEADAAYIYLARAEIDHQEETGPFILDLDSAGLVIGIEILDASKVLAPGAWREARRPDVRNADAAE